MRGNTYVRIGRSPNRSYDIGEAVEAKIAGYEINGAVALAGPVANVRFSGGPSSFSDGAESDF